MTPENSIITFITAEIILSILTMAGNSLVILAIIRTNSLHTVTNIFVGFLAAADILVGVIAAPLSAVSFAGLPRNKYGCIFVNCIILVLTNISILMLLAICLERFIAIRLPFTYDRFLTVRCAFIITACIWVLGSLSGFVPLFGFNIAPDDLKVCSFERVISMDHMVYYQFTCFIIAPIVIMLSIYAYIAVVIRRHVVQIAKQTVFSRSLNCFKKENEMWSREVRAVFFFVLLIVIFALCWLPLYTMNTINLVCPKCQYSFELLLFAVILSHANSTINPIIYAASNRKIYSAIVRMIKSLSCVSSTYFQAQSISRSPGVKCGRSREFSNRKKVVESHDSRVTDIEKHVTSKSGVTTGDCSKNVTVFSESQAHAASNSNTFTAIFE